MAKTVCKIVGVLSLIVGVAGFVSPRMLGTHLSLAHNLVHVFSGAIALYFGFAGSASGARSFCLAFGAVFLLLGVVGFVMGQPGASEMANMIHQDSRLWKVLPGTLEFGLMDHVGHILEAVLLLAGGLLGRRN